MINGYLSNQEMIQNYGILFENVKTQPELASELAEFGYDQTEIAKGKTLYDKALEEYNKNVKETQEETSAYALFAQKMSELTEKYHSDRKRMKIAFKEHTDILKNLRLQGSPARAIASILDDVRVTYSTLLAQKSLQTPLLRFKITEESLQAQLDKAAEVERAYQTYTKEKGESQQATKDKDKAFAEVEKWVREFYRIAKIALEDKPQLLESIAITVKK